jgi:hypothetical protein
MANTYTQLNTHIVFAVKGRENLLPSKIGSEFFEISFDEHYIFDFYD